MSIENVVKFHSGGISLSECAGISSGAGLHQQLAEEIPQPKAA
jgi:hypothetical protein